MGLFSSPIKTLDDLFVHTLQDIYYAENQILKNLPTMAEKASNPELKSAFQKHVTETQGHVKRLEQVFSMLGQPVKGVTCAAMDGIIAEAKEVISDCGDREVCDAAMLSSAQAVEHYEMTRYGTPDRVTPSNSAATTSPRCCSRRWTRKRTPTRRSRRSPNRA